MLIIRRLRLCNRTAPHFIYKRGHLRIWLIVSSAAVAYCKMGQIYFFAEQYSINSMGNADIGYKIIVMLSGPFGLYKIHETRHS